MSGTYSGLQARIIKQNPRARYVHCYAHCLNLVINDAVSHISEIRLFYDNLESLYVFFSAIGRWSLLMKEGTLKNTIKRVCPTRWSSRNQALDALRLRYFDVMKVLTFLSLSSKSADERSKAMSLRRYFEKFTTVILIIVQSKVLGSIDVISKVLQGKQEDIGKASEMMKSLIEELQSMRSDWDTVKLEANKLARKWNVPSHFENKRVSLTKKLADELISDQRLRDPEKRFKTEVFLKNIDIIFSQLQVRFKAVNEINILFRCLTPEILNKNDIADNELLKMADLLVEAYPDDISPSLGGQIL